MNQPLRILVVDDDRRMTRTLVDILVLNGYEAVEASSGPEALDSIKSQAFDCVLTDIKMPGMDGVELHREICKIRPGLPVVLMTAYAAEELIRQGLETGVVAAVEKPLDIQQLLTFFASLAKTPSIAVVDDDPNFCKTLGDLLELRGFRVTKVTDPYSAVDTIQADTQVVMLDMKLNQINGLDVLKELRQRHPSMPVLLVTGYRKEMAGAIQHALDLHAYACLYKPLVIADMLKTLEEIRVQQLRALLNP
ncbi:MAG: response regulator [Chloroflexota bacterium]